MRFLILLLAFIEGFVSLGVEVYSMKVASLFIGSNVMMTGTILAMILLFIALGYYIGGRLSLKSDIYTVSKLFAIAGVCYSIAYAVKFPLLAFLSINNIDPIIIAMITGVLFGIGVFFGCLAVPLMASFLSQQESGNTTGKYTGMLVAVTTIGNVVGSMVVPIYLIPFLGLTSTMQILIWLILGSSLTLLIRHHRRQDWKTLLIILISIPLYGQNFSLKGLEEHSTKVTTWVTSKIGNKEIISDSLKTISSCWEDGKLCNEYQNVIYDEFTKLKGVKEVTFIGSAGMSLPVYLALNHPEIHVVAVDLDSDLPKIVEQYFFKHPLPSNITFVGKDGRVFLNELKHTDLVIIDAFNHFTVPSNLFSVENIKQLQEKSNYVIANLIFKDGSEYDKVILNTWTEIGNPHRLELKGGSKLKNNLLCNYKCGEESSVIEYDSAFKKNYDDTPILDYLGRSIE